MRNRSFVLLATVLLASAAGCASHKTYRSAASSQTVIDGSGAPIVADSSSKHGWVERHPLLYTPGDVYHKTSHGPVVKTGAAIVVGVPVGVVHEVKNIVVGQPRASY